MSKVEAKSVKVYKPEIMNCPKCGTKLVYVYTVSNKVIQFSSGKVMKIKNMGYKCPCCNDGLVYMSATAHKMSFKGYTYSAKVVCMIDELKSKHKSRDEICDILISKGLEISDRNVDILYKKLNEYINQDYDSIIKASYQRQMDTFNEIRICVDLVTINDTYYIILYDYFNGDILGLWKTSSLDVNNLKKLLGEYINDKLRITYIVTVRPIVYFHQIIKSMAPVKCKMLSFAKF